MHKKILNYIRHNQMLSPGDRIIVALSGGADSVCLLAILNELKEELGIELEAVHVHHGIRGAEADRDSAYAKKLSERLLVPFACEYVDAYSYSKDHNMSVEEAGRHLRYEIFEKKRDASGAARIAVAHHSGDQAETILYNLFRGSGLKGLGGIRPVRDTIIRPLLCVSRKEILAYLEEKGICYCEDSTNAETDYMRNRLRHHIIPLVEREINKKAAENILHAGAMAAEADAYLEGEAQLFLEKNGVWEMDESGRSLWCKIDAKALEKVAGIVRTYVIRRIIGSLSGSMKDITMIHVESVKSLITGKSGRSVDLPYSLNAQRTARELWIKRKEKENHVEKQAHSPFPEPEFTVFPYKKGQEIPKNGYTKWFDYDKINCALSVRYRRTGDYITIAGGGRKTVKAYMIDEKIPKEERGKILLVAEGSHILWIIGHRISEYYKITDDTHTVLQIKTDGGKISG